MDHSGNPSKYVQTASKIPTKAPTECNENPNPRSFLNVLSINSMQRRQRSSKNEIPSIGLPPRFTFVLMHHSSYGPNPSVQKQFQNWHQTGVWFSIFLRSPALVPVRPPRLFGCLNVKFSNHSSAAIGEQKIKTLDPLSRRWMRKLLLLRRRRFEKIHQGAPSIP